MTIDLSKPVRLVHSRRPVRILCDDPESDYPLIGYYDTERGRRIHTAWAWDGRNYDMAGAKIENIPEKRTFWLNIYPQGEHCGHKTQEDANAVATENCIACVRVEYEEGEGL